MTNFQYKGAFWLSVVKKKPANQKKEKYHQEPIRFQRKKNTTKMPKAREKASDHVVIGFSFAERVFWTNDRAK